MFPIQETQNAIDFLDGAKDALACHCFALMLSQGLTWEEIFQSLTCRMNTNDEKGKEMVGQLQQVAEVLDLTQYDFPQLSITAFDFENQYHS
ncbi:MAG: hypothetical protein J7647_21865 [Cyanobacteria bacterium SBLK]|nr:hypothetical protein [Cyanobacteria bacterium SBLK]